MMLNPGWEDTVMDIVGYKHGSPEREEERKRLLGMEAHECAAIASAFSNAMEVIITRGTVDLIPELEDAEAGR